MREIKFRVCDKGLKDYVPIECVLGFIVGDQKGKIFKIKNDEYSIEQYTGLKEVFENDIVMFNGRKTGIVSMIDGTWTIIPEDEKDKCTYFLYSVKQITVIGNIHTKDSPNASL